MTTLTARQNQPTLDLFSVQLAGYDEELRRERRRVQLAQRAGEVAGMLDRVDSLLSVDREQAVTTLAEYSGLLELVLEDLRTSTDDESPAGANRDPGIAEQFQTQLNYLIGVFSLVASGEEPPTYDWRMVQREVQEVLGTAERIVGRDRPDEEKPRFKRARRKSVAA